MTAPLRRAHLRIWLVLALVLVATLAAALSARVDPQLLNPQHRWEQK